MLLSPTLSSVLRNLNTFKQRSNFLFVGTQRCLLNQIFAQMRRKGFDKVVHIASQESPLTEADLSDARLKQLTGIQSHQIRILYRIHRHTGDDTNPNSKTHVGLDHVGVCGGKGNPWGQALAFESVIELGAPGKAKYISD